MNAGPARRGTVVGRTVGRRAPSDGFDVNRARILRISAELFARNGYHATAISELSHAVGYGRGALYYYIGSKETLLYEISTTQVDRMNAVAEDLVAEGLCAEECLRALARELLRNIAEHRAEWTVFFREYSALSGERRDRVVAARERYEGYWRRTLEQGVRDGTFTALPALLVKGILGMFNYTYLWFEPGGPITPEALADEFLDALLDGIRA